MTSEQKENDKKKKPVRPRGNRNLKTGKKNTINSVVENTTSKVNNSAPSNTANTTGKEKSSAANTRTDRTKKAQSTANKKPQVKTTQNKKTNTSARNTKTRNSSQRNRKQKPKISISFLGGLNEIGKNITLFECQNDAFILDCGMAFPDGEMLGVDLVIPDFSYVEENKDRIKGIVLTHGHEDHIGSLPYLLKKLNIPIYGTALTLGLVGNKLKEHNLLYKTKLIEVKAGDSVELGCMKAEFIHVNHSIPDSVGVAIHSPAGIIVHTGDFKIDCTPTSGGMIDLAHFAKLGQKGVLALMADSTNAERPGYTMTEKKVADSFENIFRKAENNRIIIASFASNINRVQQIINCANKFGRKVAFSGRSMINYMAVAMELGYLDVPEGVIIDIDLLGQYPSEKVVLVTTGSQGEPMSALSRMAYSDHRKVEVGAGDVIVISAKPIPGNEKMVGNVVDELLKRGCEVLYESMYEVHVSGHACQEELKIIYGLCKPKFCIPVHGEQKHLRKHAMLAEGMGIPESNIFVGSVGNKIELNSNGIKQVDDVPAGRIFVDGLGVGDVGSIVLRDRKHLGQDGLIIVVAGIDSYDGHIITGPDIVSRGFVYVRESEALMDEIKRKATDALEQCEAENVREWGLIKNRIKDDVSRLIFERTRRSPMILPIIMDI